MTTAETATAASVRKRRPTKPKHFLATLMAIAAALVLTACGAKIDTTMNVSDTGAGQRVMVLKLAASDQSKLSGGPSAADASIRKRLPSNLTYSGMQATGDGGETATFTLTFSSPSDYITKVQDLLHAGGTGQRTPVFAVSDSVLVKGITLQESFTSADLLKWMFDGLVSDGVVSSSNSSNMYELGSGSVSFNGKTTQQSNQFALRDVQNNGFNTVAMQTAIQDPAHITRTITYTADANRYTAEKDLLSRFIADSTPAGATVATPSTGVWTITYTGDSGAVASATTKALGGAASDFSLVQSDKQGDPSEKVLALNDHASCAAACASATQPITDKVTATSGYTPQSVSVDTSTQTPTSFTLAPPIKSVDASFHVGIDGSMSAEVNLVVPETSTDAVGDGFARRLTPDSSAGTLKSAHTGSDTTYTVTIRGDNPTDFAAKYKKWAPDASVTVGAQGGNLFLQNSGYSIRPALKSLTGDHQVTDGATAKIVLPFGQWVASAPSSARQELAFNGASITVDGLASTLELISTGPTIVGLVAAAVLLVALIALAIILIRRRRAIIERLRAVRDRTTADLAEQRLLRFDRTAPSAVSGETVAGTLLRLRAEPRPLTRMSLLDLPLMAPAPPGHPIWSLIDAPLRHTPGTPRGTLFEIHQDPQAPIRIPTLI